MARLPTSVVATCAALAMVGAAGLAHAAPADAFAQSQNDFAPQPNQMGPTPPHRTLQFNNRTGRWGVSLDMAQPSDREVQWRDTRIGVNYGIAPGVRTGVSVSAGDEYSPDGRRLTNDGASPRVRLDTTLRF